MTVMTQPPPVRPEPRTQQAPTTECTIPTPIVLWLLAREPMPRPVLTALWNSPQSVDNTTTVTASVEVLDWLHLYACALTEEHICDRTAAEARYGFSVYAVDVLREETHWARVELIGP
ncbi:hypothetical protein ACPYPG_06895 [Streptomyces sp. FR-108]|uniref:hypothetical protein n=1 Tax=Streptomyces sp. FR-108 TaxID=3416665 RepID=UPI003CF2EDCB